MTGTAVLYALFGAGLVAIGVLATALADRIRSLRMPRELTPHAPIEVVEAVSAKPERVRRAATRDVIPLLARTAAKMHKAADDVIAALVAAGYKKQIATEAALGCDQDERATIENWTRAALRRCAKGAAS